MTTHYEKIQALGNRMASNLETMGVSASFSDGGLTLADKILQIQHFTDGLLLFADKKIEQAGTTQSPNTITLSALLIEDGKAKSGETVMFYGNWNVRQEKINTDSYTVYTVDGDGEFSFTGMGIIVNQGTDYSSGVGSASTFKITISNSTFSFAINGSPGLYGFTYDSTKPLEIWVPIEATNIINKFGYSDTTDSRGIATYEYTCTGAGLQSITAKTTLNGIFLQKTYEVLDATFYDKASNGVHNRWSIEKASIDYSNDYLELSSTTGTQFHALEISDGNIIKFDYYCTSLNEQGISLRQSSTAVWSRSLQQMGIDVNTWCNVKIKVNNGEWWLWVNGIDKTPTSHSIVGVNRFFFRVTTDYRIRYKNFVVYLKY